MTEEYQITWIQEGDLPHIIGGKCHKCGGIIKESQYGGAWCPKCHWKWKISKFPPKEEKQVETKVIPTSGLSPEDKEDIKKWLGLIRGDIQQLREEIQNMKRVDIHYPEQETKSYWENDKEK